MKTKPILFSTAMVQALLAGTKTQTRRTIKFSESVLAAIAEDPELLETLSLTRMQDGYKEGTRPVFELGDEPNAFSVPCPYGQPGDILWVRETWQVSESYTVSDNEYIFKADEIGENEIPWKSSIHMPKVACRLFLKIKSIRVERLNDIEYYGAKAEGVFESPESTDVYKNYLDRDTWFGHPVPSFQSLWQSINGPESWEANPWVWVVEFEKCDKPGGF